MKRICRIVWVIIFMFGIIGCGNEKTNKESSDIEIEQEGELEKEKWDDDYVITFADSGFEKYIRKALGRLEGDICYGDVNKIKRVYIDSSDIGISFLEVEDKTPQEIHDRVGNSDWIQLMPLKIENYDYNTNMWEYSSETVTCINSFEDLKYFTGLEYLYVDFNYPDLIATITNIRFLKEMRELKYLYLYNSQIYSFEGIEGCKNLEELSIGVSGATDYELFAELKKLKSIYIENGDMESLQSNVPAGVEIRT